MHCLAAVEFPKAKPSLVEGKGVLMLRPTILVTNLLKLCGEITTLYVVIIKVNIRIMSFTCIWTK